MTASRQAQKAEGVTRPAGQIPLPLPHRVSRTGDNFLVAPCNQEAVRWIDLWPDWPGPVLCLCGPAGSGKTHIASVWSAVSGAVFLDHEALTAAEPMGLEVDDPIIIDDAHLLMGRLPAEQALFHLFNRVHGTKGRVLMTGESPPARWQVALPDLRSRLGAVPVAEVGLPDDGLMAGLLVKMFADRQIAVGAEVVQFLVARMERSFEAAQGLVEALDRRALTAGRGVTIPLAREVLDGIT